MSIDLSVASAARKPVLGGLAPLLFPFRNVGLDPYNAVLNGIADDTAALQACHDALPARGGTIVVPDGSLRTTGTINITKPNVQIVSTGRRNVQDGATVGTAVNGPGMIFSDHAGACFTLSSVNETNGFGLCDITLCGNGRETGGKAVRFLKVSTTFRRDHVFLRTAITKFTTPFILETDGVWAGDQAWGVVRIQDCLITGNKWIARTLNGTQFNGFAFDGNDAGNNGYVAAEGGIHISSHAVSIQNNILEGTRDPVKLTGTYRGAVVKGNYFEACVGKACIEINGYSEFDVGPNLYLLTTADYKTWIRFAGNGRCIDPYVAEGSYNTDFPKAANDAERKIIVPTSTAAAVGMVWMNNPVFGVNHAVSESTDLVADTSVTLNSVTAVKGKTVTISSVASGVITQGVGISAVAGQWLVSQWLYRVNNAMPDADAYLILDLIAAGAGTYESPLYQARLYTRVGQWIHVFCAQRVHATITQVQVRFYPYGVNPTNPADISACVTMVQCAVFDDINDVRPGYRI